MKVSGEFHQSSSLKTFLTKLNSSVMQEAGAAGLNEHAAEQRRNAITSISSYTGVPRGRMSKVTKVSRASPGLDMTAKVITADKAVGLHEYGNPVWVRDQNPGWGGGSVSSMKGAEATGWNVRRQFPHAFVANGKVMIRTSKQRRPLKVLSMAVLANELAKPTRPNVPAAEAFAQIDLERRVLRHVIRALGT